MSERETEEERIVRESFDPDVLFGRRPFGKMLWLVSTGKRGGQGETPVTARPKLTLIRGGREE